MKEQISAFHEGKGAAFTAVKAAYHEGTWTPKLRATWIQFYTRVWKDFQQKNRWRELTSYYAGMVAALKSHHCDTFSKQKSVWRKAS